MYAIIEACGRQYKVQEGDIVYLDKLQGKEGEKLNFDKVLYVEGADFGTPYITGATVEAKLIANVKGKKIRVSTYKPKNNDRKTRGHRQKYSKVEILKINGKGSAKAEAKKDEKKAETKAKKEETKKVNKKTETETKKEEK